VQDIGTSDYQDDGGQKTDEFEIRSTNSFDKLRTGTEMRNKHRHKASHRETDDRGQKTEEG